MVSGYLLINADTEYGHGYRKSYQAELAYMVKPQHLTEAYKAMGSAPCSPLQPPLMEHLSHCHAPVTCPYSTFTNRAHSRPSWGLDSPLILPQA